MALSSAVAALLKPQADRGRNQFPLDNKQVYSMKAGQITPVKALHFMPGDFFKMRAADFSLTFPMQTAPFLRGRKEFAFYSVYYNAIWSLFNQAQATRQDPKTSAFGDTPSLTEPRINLSQLYFACLEQFCYYIYDRYCWTDKDGSQLIYYHQWLDTAKDDFMFVDSTRQFIPDANFQGLINSSASVSTVGYLESGTMTNKEFMYDVVGEHRVYSWIRKLDMLGYGNLYPLFNETERAILADNLDYTFENGQLKLATNEALWEHFHVLWLRLSDACIRNAGGGQYDSKKVNLYSICAYNSIFYHFFRNSYYDTNYSSRNYNLDFCSVSGNSYLLRLNDFSVRFLDIEYHQWKKDTFTAVLPDTQYGAVSSVDWMVSVDTEASTDQGTWYTDSVVSGNRTVLYSSSQRSLYVSTDDNPTNLSHSHSITQDIDTGFDVLALKRAEMLQDYRQTLMRAGNRTSDVFRAIYGGSPSSEHEDDIIPRFLDTFGIDIFVDPVTATADTGTATNGNLGDIAARGKFKGNSGTIKFKSGNNFGVILALCYVVPTAEYNSYMLDMHNCELSPEDHFIPQFENLGLEPVYSDELNSFIGPGDVRVLGYAPRYHHKKTQFDQVHGAFCSWFHFGRVAISEARKTPSRWYGDFNHWVSPRTDMQYRNISAVRDFYINPSVLDNVFVQAAGPDISEDQFICNTYFEIASTRQMSKVGLVNFV